MGGHTNDGTPTEWPEVTLHASPVRTLGLVALGLIFVLMGAGTLLGYPREPQGLKWLVTWVGLIFFTWGSVVLLGHGLTRGPLVSVGAKGVRDVRISPQWIPWTAITGVRPSYYGSVLLQVDPASAASIPLTRHARWTTAANALLGFRGYYITTANLKGGYAALERALDDGLARFGDR